MWYDDNDKFPRANENIFIDNGIDFDFNPQEINEILQQIEIDTRAACHQLLRALRIGIDHNTEMTAVRMAKMYIHEVFKGRYEAMPSVTTFPNHNNIDQLYTIGPVTIRSTCSHHFVPILGQAWFGVLPNPQSRVLGLSKFARLADWVFSRPQIQEEATDQLGKLVSGMVKGDGFGLVVKAKHFCTVWRGIKDNEQTMITSYLEGNLKNDHKAKAEFFELIKAQGF